jgi:tyrosyl-tRNA synthetase
MSEIQEKFIKQAELLAKGAEVLPGGVTELARKLQISEETGKPLRVKLGLDPTRPDLHLGHTVVMRKLRQFQKAGHQVVLIVGGATAMVGDPSGKSETRPPLTKEQVDENAKSYFEQMGKVVDVNGAEIVNNADWLHKMNLVDLLKLSSQITVAQMLVRDDFAKRYAEGKPISVHEFFYPLMQAYDSVEIDSDIELGGTDQRFNVLLGRDIQTAYGKKHPQMVILLPLLEGTDGVVKMSKSYPEHCISLTDSPEQMFLKLMDIKTDALMLRYFELLTDISTEEIAEMKADMDSGKVHPMELRKKLAKLIVTEYHNGEEAEKAEQYYIARNKKDVEIEWSEDLISKVTEGTLLIDLMVEKQFAESKGAAKNLIKNGGVKIDGEKVADIMQKVDFSGKESLVLQVGKKNFAKLEPQ